jgi:hypothetical protein
MPVSLQQAAAEQSIHDLLEAENPDTLADFAEFAAGEIDDKHVAALLLAILLADSEAWAFVLTHLHAMNPELAGAIARLENEQERQRAKFIEWEARGDHA